MLHWAGKTVEATLPASLNCTVLYRDRLETRLWARDRLADAIVRKDEVVGSSPTSSTKFLNRLLAGRGSWATVWSCGPIASSRPKEQFRLTPLYILL